MPPFFPRRADFHLNTNLQKRQLVPRIEIGAENHIDIEIENIRRKVRIDKFPHDLAVMRLLENPAPAAFAGEGVAPREPLRA